MISEVALVAGRNKITESAVNTMNKKAKVVV
jgi:hypothetical protein